MHSSAADGGQNDGHSHREGQERREDEEEWRMHMHSWFICVLHTWTLLGSTYMVASVTSAHIFYRKQKEVDQGSETLGWWYQMRYWCETCAPLMVRHASEGTPSARGQSQSS
jgi:hypothetical protein